MAIVTLLASPSTPDSDKARRGTVGARAGDMANRALGGPDEGAEAVRSADGPIAQLVQPKIFAPLLLLLCTGLSYWYADRSLPNPDEGAMLSAAAKILRGFVFYRDIDAYPFPGASYLLAFWMRLCGEHLSVARALGGAIYCVMVVGAYAAALPLMDRRRAALFGLSLLSFKFLAFPSYTAYFYSDLAMAGALIALALFLRHPFRGFSLRMVGVGACLGVSLVSKQNLGIYAGAAIGGIVLWPTLCTGPRRARGADAWGEIAALSLGVAILLVPMLAYFAAEGLLGQMLYSGLVRPFTGYLPTSGVSVAPPLSWWDFGSLKASRAQPYLPLRYTEMLNLEMLPGSAERRSYWLLGELFARVFYSAVLVAFAACAFARLRAGRHRAASAGADGDFSRSSLRFFVAAAISAAIVASAFPRADFPHLIIVYPAVLLVLFSLGRAHVFRAPRSIAEMLAVAVLLLVVGGLSLRYDHFVTHRLRLERAELWVRSQDVWIESLLSYIDNEVAPEEPLFVYGHEAHIYFLAGRYFPWPFVQLYPGMAGGDGGRQLSQLLLRLRPPIVVVGVP